MKKKFVMGVIALTIATTLVGCGATHPKDEETKPTESVTETIEVTPQDIKVEDLAPLVEKGVISGVKDMTVAEGTEVNLNDLIYVDNNIVKSVDVDDSAVDYNKAGTYEVIYTITFDGESLRDYVSENDVIVNFDTDGETIVVKTTVTVTVVTEEEAETAIAENGANSVVTEETKTAVKNENKANAGENAVESKPSDTAKKPSESTKQEATTKPSETTKPVEPSKPAETVKPSEPAKPSEPVKPTEPSKPVEPSKPAHTHSYKSSVTKNATCTATGTKTFKCDCGHSYTESIPALGHAMVHHDAKTHTENVLVQDAYDEPVYARRYVCNGCGAHFATGEEAGEHIMMVFGDSCQNYSRKDVQVDTIHHDAVYEKKTVVDSNAYDECSRCGHR